MSKRTVPDLKELFKQASEIAAQVPENMQEAAFNRALDLLTGEGKKETTTDQAHRKKTIDKRKPGSTVKNPDSDSPVTKLLADIDSTQYPSVTSNLKVLDRSLMVLQIALTDHDVDGLKTSDIARILTEKFRISTSTNAVNMAISKETTLVNRIPKGKGYSYRIMGPGQKYLSHLGEKDANGSRPRRRKKAAPKQTAKNAKSARNNSKKTGTPNKKKASGSRKPSTPGKIGPKAALLDLIGSGFFSKARTGPETQAFLQKKRGLNMGTDQLRLAMLRLVRDQKLERDENAEGQYEYKLPTT